MSRISLMTWGLLLVLLGVQMNFVESFVLTTRATSFLNDRVAGYDFETVPANYIATSNGYFQGSNFNTVQPNNYRSSERNASPYSTPSFQRYRNSSLPGYQAAYGNSAVAESTNGPQKLLTPPSWLCWPPIFLGSVLFLFGVASQQ